MTDFVRRISNCTFQVCPFIEYVNGNGWRSHLYFNLSKDEFNNQLVRHLTRHHDHKMCKYGPRCIDLRPCHRALFLHPKITPDPAFGTSHYDPAFVLPTETKNTQQKQSTQNPQIQTFESAKQETLQKSTDDTIKQETQIQTVKPAETLQKLTDELTKQETLQKSTDVHVKQETQQNQTGKTIKKLRLDAPSYEIK